MREARIIGTTIEDICKDKNIPVSTLSNALKCSEYQIHSMLKGLLYASFDQLMIIANILNVPLEDIICDGTRQHNRTEAHCIDGFKDIANREFILDLIADYIDIKNAARVQ